EGDAHARLDQKLVRSQDALLQRDRGALYLLRRSHHLEHVIHARRLEELDLHRAHYEGETRRLGACLFEQRAMSGADEAQMIGAAALHEAQIGGVIDDSGKVGVLVIDANGHDMTAIAQLAVERVHRNGTGAPIAASQFLPSNGFGKLPARSMSSRQRTLTSILSGSERGT